MGSGKSTVGKKLARNLNLDFFDLDTLIEAKAGKSIPEIFHNSGEDAFRKIERECLSEILSADNYVLSTGGGTPCFFDNMQKMNEKGITIYLKMEPGMLAHRLRHSKSERPLLAGKKAEVLIDFVFQNLEEREKFYLQANHIVNAKSLRLEKLLNRIDS
jgi:shikimate kinase